MKKTIMLLAVAGMLGAGQAMAAKADMKPDDFSTSRFYFGVGPTKNSPDASSVDDANGFDVLVGYDLGMGFDQFKLMLEAGYFDSGDFEYTTVIPFFGPIKVKESAESRWATAVLSFSPVKNLDLMVRAGYESGDNGADGAIGGAGVGYWFTRNIGARATFTKRDEIDSIGLSFLYSL